MGREDPIEFYNLNLINYLFFHLLNFIYFIGEIFKFFKL